MTLGFIHTTSDRHTVQAKFNSTISACSQRSRHSGGLDLVHSP